MTFTKYFAIIHVVIVSQKLAKPVTGGEPVGLSLFYIKEILMATTHHKSFATVEDQISIL